MSDPTSFDNLTIPGRLTVIQGPPAEHDVMTLGIAAKTAATYLRAERVAGRGVLVVSPHRIEWRHLIGLVGVPVHTHGLWERFTALRFGQSLGWSTGPTTADRVAAQMRNARPGLVIAVDVGDPDPDSWRWLIDTYEPPRGPAKHRDARLEDPPAVLVLTPNTATQQNTRRLTPLDTTNLDKRQALITPGLDGTEGQTVEVELYRDAETHEVDQMVCRLHPAKPENLRILEPAKTAEQVAREWLDQQPDAPDLSPLFSEAKT